MIYNRRKTELGHWYRRKLRNEQLRFCDLVNKQKDLDSEFNEVVNNNFWDLLKP